MYNQCLVSSDLLTNECSLTICVPNVPEWCSGSTADFDSASLSSILSSGAKQKHTKAKMRKPMLRKQLHLLVGLTGSIPVSVFLFGINNAGITQWLE